MSYDIANIFATGMNRLAVGFWGVSWLNSKVHLPSCLLLCLTLAISFESFLLKNFNELIKSLHAVGNALVKNKQNNGGLRIESECMNSTIFAWWINLVLGLSTSHRAKEFMYRKSPLLTSFFTMLQWQGHLRLERKITFRRDEYKLYLNLICFFRVCPAHYVYYLVLAFFSIAFCANVRRRLEWWEM